MRYVSYFLAQLKRFMRYWGVILLFTGVLFFGCLIVGRLLVRESGRLELAKKIRVGLVGDFSGHYLSMGIHIVTTSDSSKDMIEFQIMEKKEAENSLKRGKIDAFLEIPEDFVESIMVGENRKVNCYSSEGVLEISTILLQEVLDEVSDMVLQAQAAGSGNAIVFQDIDMANRLDLKYLVYILSRTELYEIETIDLEAGVSPEEYYCAAISIFFLLLWGIGLAPAATKKQPELDRILFSKGRSVTVHVFAEMAAYSLFFLISILPIYTVGMWSLKRLSGGNLLRILPVILLIAGLQFLLYEMTDHVLTGVLLQFVAAISLAFLSGCFYPTGFFPLTIQRVACHLPTGVGLRFLLQGEGLAKLVGYMVLCFLLTVMIRKRRRIG